MEQYLPSGQLLGTFVVLSAGELLYLLGFHVVFVLALVYFAATVVPYPAVCRSLLSRLAVGFVLVMSLLQAVAALQFLVLPNTGFAVISLVTYCICAGLAFLLRRKKSDSLVLIAKRDVQAVVMALFFVLPVAALFFGSTNPARILGFTGIQSPDAASHYTGIQRMASVQHLDYRSVTYYPRGFHLASAFFLDGAHATQKDVTWLQGQRIFVGLYVVWGAVVGYLVFYLASQALEALMAKKYSGNTGWLLAITLGPVISLLYLVPFVYYGFLNYYYIVAAVICGLLYLYEYDAAKLFDAPLALYMLCVFGVSMSWGPLLAPALFLIPVLYVVKGWDLRSLPALLRRRALWALVAVYVAGLIPIYIYFNYAHLKSTQGIDAVGIMTDFHFGIVLLGLGLLLYFMLRPRTARLNELVVNTLLSFYILVGVLVGIQYFKVGELRYYAIKTAYLAEMLVLAFLAAWLIWECARRIVLGLREWIALPVVFGMVIMLSLGLTANPLLPVRQVFRGHSGYPQPSYYSSDVASFAKLATEQKLAPANSEALHYNVTASKVYGNALLQTAAMATVSARRDQGSSAAATCANNVYFILTYGTGSASEQAMLVANIKSCIAIARQHHEAYYVVTDQTSAGYLRNILGPGVTYVY